MVTVETAKDKLFIRNSIDPQPMQNRSSAKSGVREGNPDLPPPFGAGMEDKSKRAPNNLSVIGRDKTTGVF
jgi:hypothetical protein